MIRHGFTQRGLRRNHGLWTAAGSEAPRRFWMPPVVRKAVSPLRSATAVQIFVIGAPSLQDCITDCFNAKSSENAEALELISIFQVEFAPIREIRVKKPFPFWLPASGFGILRHHV